MTDKTIALPDLTYLRKLLGHAWVETEVLGADPTHPLGRHRKSDPNNPWVPYVEGLVKFILTDTRIKCLTKDLSRKFKAEYTSTVAEMEAAVFLTKQGFFVTFEPNAPRKGPDLLVEREGISYFVEIREVGLSWEEDRIQRISKEVFARLRALPSRYSVAITIGEAYTPSSPKLEAAIAVVVEVLELLTKREMQKATFYYVHPQGKLLNPGGDAGQRFSGSEPHYQGIVDKADFIARFSHVGKDQTETPVSLSKIPKFPPEPVDTHERLKNILVEKSSQLPKNSRGILLLEVTEQFLLSDFTIERALYGDLEVSFAPVSGPSEPVGEMTLRSNERGFFGQTGRVSAVVIHTRTFQDAVIQSSWQVYPTNRANSDTIRLSLGELERFGDIGDRKHLSA
jgi:hypothetical protein